MAKIIKEILGKAVWVILGIVLGFVICTYLGSIRTDSYRQTISQLSNAITKFSELGTRELHYINELRSSRDQLARDAAILKSSLTKIQARYEELLQSNSAERKQREEAQRTLAELKTKYQDMDRQFRELSSAVSTIPSLTYQIDSAIADITATTGKLADNFDDLSVFIGYVEQLVDGGPEYLRIIQQANSDLRRICSITAGNSAIVENGSNPKARETK